MPELRWPPKREQVFVLTLIGAEDERRVKTQAALQAAGIHEATWCENLRHVWGGEAGCLQAHAAAWAQIVRAGLPWALILEDNVRFREHAVKPPTKLPTAWQVLYLHDNGFDGSCWSATHIPELYKLRPPLGVEQAWPVCIRGTSAYVLSLRGAKACLAALKSNRIYAASDGILADACKRHAYVVRVPPFMRDTSIDTTTQASWHNVMRPWIINEPVVKLAAALRRNRVLDVTALGLVAGTVAVLAGSHRRRTVAYTAAGAVGVAAIAAASAASWGTRSRYAGTSLHMTAWEKLAHVDTWAVPEVPLGGYAIMGASIGVLAQQSGLSLKKSATLGITAAALASTLHGVYYGQTRAHTEQHVHTALQALAQTGSSPASQGSGSLDTAQ